MRAPPTTPILVPRRTARTGLVMLAATALAACQVGKADTSSSSDSGTSDGLYTGTPVTSDCGNCPGTFAGTTDSDSGSAPGTTIGQTGDTGTEDSGTTDGSTTDGSTTGTEPPDTGL